MGGIPFRSTGCNTCRRRKVKCDETKPECLKCVKNGHVCTGYERQRTFIHKSSTVQSAHHQPQQRPKDTSASRRRQPVDAGPSVSVGVGAGAAGAGPLVVANNHNGPININLNIINGGSIPRFDARPEIRSQLLSSFVDTYLPTSQLLPNANLFKMLPGLVGGSPLLDKAIVSLSSAFVATQNQDDRLLQYSTKLYSNALETLQGKIKMGKSLGKDLLYTTIIFQVYELINCSLSGFPAWLAHVQGSNAIIRQCDSRNQTTHAENLFLRQLRFVILCDAIGKRKAASHYNIPPLPERSPGSTFQLEPMDEFVGLLVECSSLIEQVDQLVEFEQGGPASSRRSGERLLCACLSLEEKLHNVCISMQDKLGIPSRLPKESHILNEFRATILKDFFAEPLWFPSLTCAESHMMYWTMLVLLYPLMDQLFSFLGPSPSSAASTSEGYPSIEPESERARLRTESPPTTNIIPPKPDDFFALADVYATEICRSVAYILQPDMKSLGAQMLLAPFSQATQFFQVQEAVEKVHWCQAVFMMLPKMGLRIGPFLKDLVWPQYRISQKRRSPTPPEQDERHELIVPLD